jgi:hypothetical protein
MGAMLFRAGASVLSLALVLLACGGRGYDPAYPQQSACPGGMVSAGDQCACPEGTQWNGAECTMASACPPGSVQNGDECTCPPGTQWGGSSCQVVVEQRTRQSTTNLTCCVNHAQYKCPDDAAFQRCATLAPNHGCTPAGRC